MSLWVDASVLHCFSSPYVAYLILKLAVITNLLFLIIRRVRLEGAPKSFILSSNQRHCHGDNNDRQHATMLQYDDGRLLLACCHGRQAVSPRLDRKCEQHRYKKSLSFIFNSAEGKSLARPTSVNIALAFFCLIKWFPCSVHFFAKPADHKSSSVCHLSADVLPTGEMTN